MSIYKKESTKRINKSACNQSLQKGKAALSSKKRRYSSILRHPLPRPVHRILLSAPKKTRRPADAASQIRLPLLIGPFILPMLSPSSPLPCLATPRLERQAKGRRERRRIPTERGELKLAIY
ncbi:hypothetical protein [Aeromonas sp. S16(2024)]|uniref:hypothetical protein n=1 Tax=Aeromonas sp. S16(2024) TaxID=3242889 RepID=UPI00352793C9